MTRRIFHSIGAAGICARLLLVPGQLSAQNPYTSSYQHLTNYETSIFAEQIKFLSGDTLQGPVHSNETIAIMQSPVFYDSVSTSADNFWQGPGYNPVFMVPPVFNAPRVALPATAAALRDSATAQGRFYDDDNGQLASRVLFNDDQGWILYQWPMGQPFADSIVAFGPPLAGAAIWVDGYLELKGIFRGVGAVGASGNLGYMGRHCIRLLDNVRYYFADPSTGEFNDTTGGYQDMLAIISEGDIVIANTWENGRNNCAQGRDIVITAALVALDESFTFEDQNDSFIWEYSTGYISPTYTDHRGDIMLHGSLTQHRRGYVHRNNHGAPGGGPMGDTGYGKHYYFDERFREQSPPCGILARHIPLLDPPSVDFGNVQINNVDTALVALRNEGGTFIEIDTAYTNTLDLYAAPLDSTTLQPGDSLLFEILFRPLAVGQYRDTLRIELYYGGDLIVPLAGYGIATGIGITQGPPDDYRFCAFPNPFNPTIVLRYELREANFVRLSVHDLSGRLVSELVQGWLEAGKYEATFAGAGLPSGIYFARLDDGHTHATRKLILMK